jgi:hypothetical protein
VSNCNKIFSDYELIPIKVANHWDSIFQKVKNIVGAIASFQTTKLGNSKDIAFLKKTLPYDSSLEATFG